MPLKASLAKSMCCTVVGPTYTFSLLLFLSHLSLSQIAISGRSSACLGGRRYGSKPPEVGSAVLALGSARVVAASPPVRGVLGPRRAALRPIANMCWCKRRLVRPSRCFGPRLQLRTYHSEAPCHALPPPIGHQMGSEAQGPSSAVPPSPHPLASRNSHASTHRCRAPRPMGGSLVVTLMRPMGWVWSLRAPGLRGGGRLSGQQDPQSKAL